MLAQIFSKTVKRSIDNEGKNFVDLIFRRFDHQLCIEKLIPLCNTLFFSTLFLQTFDIGKKLRIFFEFLHMDFRHFRLHTFPFYK